MPALDRRIIVRRSATSFNEYGEPVSVETDIPVWATRADASQRDKEEAGGALDEPIRRYTVRWTRDIAAATTSQLSVIDGTLTMNAINVIDQPERGERRRFLIIECTGEELTP